MGGCVSAVFAWLCLPSSSLSMLLIPSSLFHFYALHVVVPILFLRSSISFSLSSLPCIYHLYLSFFFHRFIVLFMSLSTLFYDLHASAHLSCSIHLIFHIASSSGACFIAFHLSLFHLGGFHIIFSHSSASYITRFIISSHLSFHTVLPIRGFPSFQTPLHLPLLVLMSFPSIPLPLPRPHEASPLSHPSVKFIDLHLPSSSSYPRSRLFFFPSCMIVTSPPSSS